jgi:hypothetical protein
MASLAASHAAFAQESNDHVINAMVVKERQTFGPPPPKRQHCAQGNADEIVVCAPDHGEDQRVPSSTEDDPASRAALRDGRPHAPQLDQGYCAKCPHFGKVPPPVYYFDIKALPEAPEGSDADRIAKGELAEP